MVQPADHTSATTCKHSQALRRIVLTDRHGVVLGAKQQLRCAESKSMAEVFVAKIAEFPDGERKIVQHGAHDIGVFHWEGQFYAYSNYCLHQGGPACEGLTIANVEERLRADKTSMGLHFTDQMNFVCPWHGYEYDLKTGECVGDRKQKLRKFEVIERGGDIYVVA